ncbi:MAG: histidinol-phosphate transaminase [Rikenellaceae bacterium]
MINGHGNNIYQYGVGAIEHDFSSNIAFNNLSQPILEHLGRSIDVIRNYPDPQARALTNMIATHIGRASEDILVTNGSAEAFYLIAQYFAAKGECKAAIVTPSFAEYEDSCKAYNHQIDHITFDELLNKGIDISIYDTLWIGLPNNPDGRKISTSQIRDIAEQNPTCTIIIDRAYNELSSDAESDWTLPRNTIIVDSFTKLYGIPGIRIGYIAADQAIINSLAEMRPPWSVNALSLVAGEYIMQNLDALQPNIDTLMCESKYLQQEIALLDGFNVTQSNCNFFLIEITKKGRDAAQLQQYLIEKHKILIRDCSNFRGLTSRHFRIAAQERAACDKLIKALKEWL